MSVSGEEDVETTGEVPPRSFLLTNDDDNDGRNDEDNPLSGEYHSDPAIFADNQQSSLFDSIRSVDGPGAAWSIGSDAEAAEELVTPTFVGGNYGGGHGNCGSREQSNQNELRVQLPPSPLPDSDASVTSSLQAHGNQFPAADASRDPAGNRLFEVQHQLSIFNQPPPPLSTPNWLTSAVASAQLPAAATISGAGAMPSVHALLGGIPQRSQGQVLQPNGQQHTNPMFPQQQPINNALIPNTVLPLLHPIAQLAGLAPFPYSFPGPNFSNGLSKPPAMGNPLFVPLMAANASSSSTRSMLPNVVTQGLLGSPAAQVQGNLPPLLPPARRSKRPQTNKGAIGVGSIEPFPEKLHRLLREVEAAGRSEVISFVDKDAFRIHKPEIFFREVVPSYFNHTRLSSFKRQLNLYGFVLVMKGIAQGGYRHALFRKDEPELCRKIRRVAIKQQNRHGATKSPTPSISEDIDSMNSDIHDPDNPTSFKDLDDDTDLQDSIGSTDRSDMLLSMPDADHESVTLHDAYGLDFEPPL